MRGPTSGADLGVYVHIPFCERICPYCDFAVEAAGALEPGLGRAYVDGLLRELDLARRDLAPALDARRLASVYLGGGTPSLLPGGEVGRLLRALEARFEGPPHEVTLEANPGVLEVERVPEFRAAGVTRLSVGLQSFRDETLKRLGRAHSGLEALRGLEACLRAGFPSLSVDLIYGAPEQSVEHLLADLERVIDLEVPHVSAYALSIEPGTPFASARRAGHLPLPDEDEVLAMSRAVRSRLGAARYRQYEISSFARPGHRSRHNQRYWLRRDVLGLGAAAASLIGNLRFQNHRRRPDWTEALRAGLRPVACGERLSGAETRRETLALGFRRLEGVSRAAYSRRFGARPEDHFGAELGELRALGLVADRAGFVRLTERGILFADEVFLRFAGR